MLGRQPSHPGRVEDPARGNGELVKGAEHARLVLARDQQPGSLQDGCHLGAQEREQLHVAVAHAAARVAVHRERPERLVADHQRHGCDLADPAGLTEGRRVGPGGIVLDDEAFAALVGEPDRPFARQILGLVRIGVVVGQHPQRPRLVVEPGQRRRVRLQDVPGAVDHQAGEDVRLMDLADRDRDLVEGPEGPGLRLPLRDQAGGLERGGHLRREQHEQGHVVGAELALVVGPDAQRPDRAVFQHERDGDR